MENVRINSYLLTCLKHVFPLALSFIVGMLNTGMAHENRAKSCPKRVNRSFATDLNEAMVWLDE